jgi:hypothetical protein
LEPAVKPVRIVRLPILLLGASLVAGAANAKNLIGDGGFETPPSPASYFTTYSPGAMIGEWSVTGSGNVATVNNYNEGGVLWSAHRGKAFLDLTGTCDCGANSGVAQTIKTVVGATYQVTFWVGNTTIQGQGSTSTVQVYIGSNLLITAKNKAKGNPTEVWRKFVTGFTATAGTTTISFVNADPNGDEQNGLDDVTIVAK